MTANKNDANRYIADYARITGLPASKIRYYEKLGLQGIARHENGYRSFNIESIYKLNYMKSLCARGFSIKESLQLTQEPHTVGDMLTKIREKEEQLAHQLILTRAMKNWAEETRQILEKLEQGNLLYLEDKEDQMFLPACEEGDFSIGIQNGDVRRRWNDFFPVNRLVGTLDAAGLADQQRIQYGDVVSVSNFHRFHLPADETVKRLPMGKCLCFNFQENPDGFFSLAAYPHVQQYLAENHLEAAGKVLLSYLFLFSTDLHDNEGIAFIPVREKKRLS